MGILSQHLRRLSLALGVFLIVLTSAASAQPFSSGGGGDSGSPRRSGVLSDLMDAMDSGSRMLIEAVQPGESRDLVEDPRFNSQASPRAATMTLIEAMALVDRGHEEVGYRRAMASLPEGTAEDTATEIYQILLRLGPISPAELPGTRQIDETGDTRFILFPRSIDHRWVWEAADPAPGAQLALEQGGDGKWRFTPATVEAAPALLTSLEGLAPQYFLDGEDQYFIKVFAPLVEQTSGFEWLAFLAVCVGGIFAGLAFSKLFAWLARRAEKLEQVFLGSTLRGLGNAGGLVVVTFFLTIAIGFLELGPVLRGLRYEIPRFLMIIAVALFVISLVDVFAAYIRRRIDDGGNHYDKMVVTMIRRILRTLIIALVLLFVLQNIFGVNVGALLIGFGFIALALSLAAQDVVKNMFGAISIFINRPFVIGDWIIFKGESDEHIGTVQDIELQATKLEQLDGNLVTIPNMLFIDREVENLSARGHIRRQVKIAVPYGSDSQTIEEAIAAVWAAFTDEEVIKDALAEGRDATPHVSFSDFQDSWLGLTGYHYYFMGDETEQIQREAEGRGWFSFLDHCSLVNRKIVAEFERRGLTFAFPTQTIQLDKS